MNIVKMIQFGRTLTDRPDGKKVFSAILAKFAPPIGLDFSGVVALGSSFADEVVIKIAKLQGNRISVIAAKEVIKNCILRVIEGSDIEVNFQ